MRRHGGTRWTAFHRRWICSGGGVGADAKNSGSPDADAAEVGGDDDGDENGGWETVVGLELHVQVAANTKLFSG